MGNTSSQKIRKWFYNNYDTPQKQYVKFTRKWSARSAYFQENRAHVLEEATKVSGISAGRPGYLGAIQREITRQWENIPLEEKNAFQDLADEWSSGKAPDAVKRRLVILPSHRSLRSFPYIQNGIFHAKADYPEFPNPTIQDVWGSGPGADFIYR
jgi:hypothetical protein